MRRLWLTGRCCRSRAVLVVCELCGSETARFPGEDDAEICEQAAIVGATNRFKAISSSNFAGLSVVSSLAIHLELTVGGVEFVELSERTLDVAADDTYEVTHIWKRADRDERRTRLRWRWTCCDGSAAQWLHVNHSSERWHAANQATRCFSVIKSKGKNLPAAQIEDCAARQGSPAGPTQDHSSE